MQSAQPMDLSHIRNTIRGLNDTLHSKPQPHAAQLQASPHPSSTHRVKKRRSTAKRPKLAPLRNIADVTSKIIVNPRRWWEGVVGRHHKRRQREQLRRQLRELSIKFSLGGRRRASPGGGRIDTTLAWGDILMMTATQIASERIPLTQAGFLSGVLVATWVGVASMKGDYQRRRTEPLMPFFGDHYRHMFRALLTSASTWIIFVPTTVVVCMSLLSRHYLDWAPFAAKHAAEDMPAEAEVLLASLWTLGAWRGTYAMLRPFL
ncbi:hypothetical protein WJX73_008124 [Symbiochloris irregularis]|uniref:Uncharacterized protein n=1 Tax=Symbiochloris irregularis TaxID=706552 RepID=A0AAW1NN14_9CHLO